VKQYIVDLVGATRSSPTCAWAPPRARACSWCAPPRRAALDGRDYVLPDDVQALAVSVLAHRLLPTAEAQVARRSPESVVTSLVERTSLPGPAGSRRR
jgi:MoxR-like ATPase